MKPPLRLDWIDHRAARFACERWHYSGTLPKNKSNWIGVWEGDRFVGAIIFGLGASPCLGSPFGAGKWESAELTRVALRAHEHPVSRMVAIATRMVRRLNPGLRVLISFADPFHDHHGGIYQALGWTYTGTTAPSFMWKLADGSLADHRRFDGHGHNKPMPIPRGSVKLRTPGKHRYVLVLDPALQERVEALRQPYPKRERKDQAAEHHSALGGETPTRSLQSGEAA